MRMSASSIAHQQPQNTELLINKAGKPYIGNVDVACHKFYLETLSNRVD